MKPIPIPDDLILPGSDRVTISAPTGMEDNIKPVEVLSALTDFGMTRMLLIELNDEDLQELVLQRKFWLVFIGQIIVPFNFIHVSLRDTEH